jgi:hypothetical protein
MSKVAIKLSTLTDIGNAVRAKKGTAEQIPVANLANEIQSIQGGTDTSADTVTAETMLEGVTAHNASGEPIVGTIPLYDGAVTGGLSVMANASKYLYGREAKKNTICNGVELPDIDTVWDKETYPYAMLALMGATGILSIMSLPFYVGDGEALYATDNCSAKVFLGTNNQEGADLFDLPCGEWVCTDEGEVPKGAELGTLNGIVWVSHDILNADGSVAMATTELSYEYTETPTHTIDGVGYVGTILPNIDEVWTDKETYPYVLVAKSGFPIDGADMFICMSSSCYAVYEDDVNFLRYTESGNAKAFIVVNNQEVADELGVPFGEWLEQETTSFEKDDSNGLSSYYVWTSHDIYRDDGTLCWKAIEPIPIYE